MSRLHMGMSHVHTGCPADRDSLWKLTSTNVIDATLSSDANRALGSTSRTPYTLMAAVVTLGRAFSAQPDSQGARPTPKILRLGAGIMATSILACSSNRQIENGRSHDCVCYRPCPSPRRGATASGAWRGVRPSRSRDSGGDCCVALTKALTLQLQQSAVVDRRGAGAAHVGGADGLADADSIPPGPLKGSCPGQSA